MATSVKFVTNGADGGGGGKVWTNPTNIYADDANSASYYSYDEPGSMNELIGKTCDFSAIPAGSTIDGVMVSFKGSSITGVYIGATTVYLNKTDNTRSANGITLTDDGAGLYHAGGATEKWGETLTLAVIQHANFGGRLLITAFDTSPEHEQTFAVNYMKLTVYYTEPAGNTGAFFQMF